MILTYSALQTLHFDHMHDLFFVLIFRLKLNFCNFNFQTHFLLLLFLFFFIIRTLLHHMKTEKKTNEWKFCEIWTSLLHTAYNRNYKKSEKEILQLTSFQLLFASVENSKLILGSRILVDWHLTVWNYQKKKRRNSHSFSIWICVRSTFISLSIRLELIPYDTVNDIFCWTF